MANRYLILQNFLVNSNSHSVFKFKGKIKFITVRAYPSEAHFSCFTLGLAPVLTHKHLTWLQKLAGDKYSSVRPKFVHYGQKKFYNIGPRGAS
jgi:hypothetical protein